MMAAMRHRGPDDARICTCGDRKVVLCHNRILSIIDLTAGGHQPMVNPNQRRHPGVQRRDLQLSASCDMILKK